MSMSKISQIITILPRSLSGNELTTLDATTFDGLNNLTTLHLQGNLIGKIAKGTFMSLPNLKILYLHDNALWNPVDIEVCKHCIQKPAQFMSSTSRVLLLIPQLKISMAHQLFAKSNARGCGACNYTALVFMWEEGEMYKLV